MAGGRVRELALGQLDCMVMGAGPPLVILPGVAPENGRPVGLMRAAEVQIMTSFAGAFTTYWVGRPTGLQPGTSFSDIAAMTAEPLAAEFGGPVNVLGISTGGSLAQQLAAEHPAQVRRLVLMSTGFRLGTQAAALQHRMIELAGRGRPRPLMAAIGRELVPAWRGRSVAAAALYAVGPSLYPAAGDLADLTVTLQAEDAFDLRVLPAITAPTLIISGAHDRFYELDIIQQTAQLIPGSRLTIYARCGHVTVVTDRGAVREVIEFLSAS